VPGDRSEGAPGLLPRGGRGGRVRACVRGPARVRGRGGRTGHRGALVRVDKLPGLSKLGRVAPGTGHTRRPDGTFVYYNARFPAGRAAARQLHVGLSPVPHSCWLLVFVPAPASASR
jgi:hypothetical protein